jgi:hypothetical protein
MKLGRVVTKVAILTRSHSPCLSRRNHGQLQLGSITSQTRGTALQCTALRAGVTTCPVRGATVCPSLRTYGFLLKLAWAAKTLPKISRMIWPFIFTTLFFLYVFIIIIIIIIIIIKLAWDRQPHSHLWADCLDNMATTTPQKPIDLHGLLRG